jgi:phosphatidylserine/phosphatidylglycerophosphate/cardiolipin synthase-like enzyme
MSGLGSFVKQVIKIKPTLFSLELDRYHWLKSPLEFFNLVCEKLSNSKRHVAISSLYIGDGEKESKILDILDKKLLDGVPVSILVDGNRQKRSPLSLGRLDDLRQKYSNLKMLLYKNSRSRQFNVEKGGRIWESLGVHHMKFLVLDDDLIFSGY